MDWRRLLIFLLVITPERSLAQNTRSFKMLSMNGWQFQCVTTTCLPYTTITASNIFRCQASCLGQVQCKAASFQRSTSGCQLFDNTMNQNDPMDANMDTIGMTVISGTRTPPGKFESNALEYMSDIIFHTL
ncbi:unnamed protein product [Adineta ricciae]|uniref:Apple domain-containing protein n=1 Tax=Adineta ricciae TaxID=249248 RepID=A0A815VYL3_ADIRI|nr:unnamed protein product [Adineta ricciae]CAF1597373.1 unnamed protein product [Adineta ricciae]